MARSGDRPQRVFGETGHGVFPRDLGTGCGGIFWQFRVAGVERSEPPDRAGGSLRLTPATPEVPGELATHLGT